jgi:hypothetical protein
MKKLLLTSIAALFLATGAARADDPSCSVILSDGPPADTTSPEDLALYDRCMKEVPIPRPFPGYEKHYPPGCYREYYSHGRRYKCYDKLGHGQWMPKTWYPK